MVIFPAGIACIIGGACTLVGSVSQVTANSILMGYAGYEEGLGVFDMSRVMVPAAILQVVFWATAGYSLLKWALKPGSPDFDKNNSFARPPGVTRDGMPDFPRWKGTLSVVVLVGCIVLFILCGFAPFNKYFNIANIALLGATNHPFCNRLCSCKIHTGRAALGRTYLYRRYHGTRYRAGCIRRRCDYCRLCAESVWR